jgi:hypothetical protein
MDCPECGADTLPFPVPEDLQFALPGDEPGVALCRRCLTIHPVSDPPAEHPDFRAISDAFPSNAEAAVPMALLVGLVGNLALYRSEISDLLSRVEQAGPDPLLVLNRLDRDPDLAPDADLSGRRRQLEQLL